MKSEHSPLPLHFHNRRKQFFHGFLLESLAFLLCLQQLKYFFQFGFFCRQIQILCGVFLAGAECNWIWLIPIARKGSAVIKLLQLIAVFIDKAVGSNQRMGVSAIIFSLYTLSSNPSNSLVETSPIQFRYKFLAEAAKVAKIVYKTVTVGVKGEVNHISQRREFLPCCYGMS